MERPHRTARCQGTRVVRLSLAALACAALACASPGMPPGGPPDTAPPALLAASPESGAVNVKARVVELRFDEVVNERSSAGGVSPNATGSTLAGLIVVSPSDGRERVQWKRNTIEIEPRGGLRPNTAYRVSVLPGLGDLRGNALKERHEVVFSTGSSIPDGTISGAIFDWVTGRPALLARVEAFRDDDTTFRWVSRADSSGRFTVKDLAPGAYTLRGWIDTNNDRAIGTREPFDVVRVEVAGLAQQDLYAFEHDTIGPRIELVEVVDSSVVRVRFDRAVATGFTPDSTSIRLVGADSVPIRLGLAVPSMVFDSVRRVAAAAADTAKPEPAPEPAPKAAARSATDSTRQAPPLMQRPIPVTTWVAPLPTLLAPGEYRLTVRGFPGLAGASRNSERVFRVRPPPVPKDTTAPPTRPPG